MNKIVFAVLAIVATLTMSLNTTPAGAQGDCATIEDCAAIAAAAKARGNVFAQQTAEAKRATVAAARVQAKETADAAPTITPWPTMTPQTSATAQPSSTPVLVPTVTPAPTAMPLPTAIATNKPSALDRIVDRILAEPTAKREGTAPTPWTTYLVLALLVLFVIGMMKVIFGQITTILPGGHRPTTREDDELNT